MNSDERARELAVACVNDIMKTVTKFVDPEEVAIPNLEGLAIGIVKAHALALLTDWERETLERVVYMLQGMQTDAVNMVDRGNVIDRVRYLAARPAEKGKADAKTRNA